MISGFNTDVEFDKIVYHIQTEDKGLKSRMIISLVYDGGTILASKRVSYDDLLKGEFDEKKLAEGINRQHKLMCAAVKVGRIDDLIEMTGRERMELDPTPVNQPVAEAAAAIAAKPVAVARVETERIIKVVETRRVETTGQAVHAEPPISPPDPFDEVIVDGVRVIEDETVLPAEAVVVVSELSGKERPSHTKLSLELLGDSKFKGGDRRTVNIMVCRGTERKVINNAEIMIKVLGSSFRPVIFHARSDGNGLAKIHMQLPHFDAGRAALLIRAISGGEEIELRRAVTPG